MTSFYNKLKSLLYDSSVLQCSTNPSPTYQYFTCFLPTISCRHDTKSMSSVTSWILYVCIFTLATMTNTEEDSYLSELKLWLCHTIWFLICISSCLDLSSILQIPENVLERWPVRRFRGYTFVGDGYHYGQGFLGASG